MRIPNSIIDIIRINLRSFIAPSALLLLFLLAFSPLTSAAALEPSYGTAIIDGDKGEWNLADDFFTNMYRTADETKPIESKLYIRYDASQGVLYVLVLVEPNAEVKPAPASSAYIRIDGSKVVDGDSGNNGVPPDFAWVYDSGVLVGYEASFVLAPGTYNLRFI